jgi:hypothetical protein
MALPVVSTTSLDNSKPLNPDHVIVRFVPATTAVIVGVGPGGGAGAGVESTKGVEEALLFPGPSRPTSNESVS